MTNRLAMIDADSTRRLREVMRRVTALHAGAPAKPELAVPPVDIGVITAKTASRPTPRRS